MKFRGGQVLDDSLLNSCFGALHIRESEWCWRSAMFHLSDQRDSSLHSLVSVFSKFESYSHLLFYSHPVSFP